MANIVENALNSAVDAGKGIVNQGVSLVNQGVDTVKDFFTKESPVAPVGGMLPGDAVDDDAYEVLQYPLNDLAAVGGGRSSEMFITFQTLDRPPLEHEEATDKTEKDEFTMSRAAQSYNPTIIKDVTGLFTKAPSRLPNLKAEPVGPQVRLAIPQAVQFADGMNYNQAFNLGVIGAGLESAIKGGATVNVPQIAADAISKGVSSIMEGLTANIDTDVGAVAAQRVAGKLNQTVGGAITSATQTTINPHNRTLFEQVATRTFGFSFVLVATSAKEAQTIEKIVRHFRESMYPEDIFLKSELTGDDMTQFPAIGYRFPRKFKIRFWDSYTDREVLQPIRECFLQSFNTTYNSADATFHEDGQPTSVEITMQFIEDRPLSRQMVQQMYAEMEGRSIGDEATGDALDELNYQDIG